MINTRAAAIELTQQFHLIQHLVCDNGQCEMLHQKVHHTGLPEKQCVPFIYQQFQSQRSRIPILLIYLLKIDGARLQNEGYEPRTNSE